MNLNVVFYHSSTAMSELNENSVDLIITSPPYFNIKDYAKNGYQNATHSKSIKGDLGALNDYESYISELLKVWRECERVLKPNAKLCINVPLMPMLKKDFNTHYNRHIFDLQSDIQHSILERTKLFLLDMYIWNRTNSTKKLMFGSYPYPRNFYAQNTTEFITIFVKDGKRGMTLKVAKELKRNFVGYEIYEHYKSVIEEKLSSQNILFV